MIAALLRRTSAQPKPLFSPRLRMVTITRAMLEAETEPSTAHLASLLHVQVPSEWPPALWEAPVWVHMAAELDAHPETAGWYRYMVRLGEPQCVIGCLGAFLAAHGDVELGYSVVREEQGKGFATEAVLALTAWLLGRPQIRSVSAQAFQNAVASVRVMQRCGMVCVGQGDQPGTVRYRRWRT